MQYYREVEGLECPEVDRTYIYVLALMMSNMKRIAHKVKNCFAAGCQMPLEN